MKITTQNYEILNLKHLVYKDMLELTEQIGRLAYKSEGNITEGSAERFVRMIIKREHFSVMEHILISVKITTNRAIANEIVRHRTGKFLQESTRYCNYSHDKFGGEVTFIEPECKDDKEKSFFYKAFERAEKDYFDLIGLDVKPEIARGTLPLDLKTEIVVTFDIRGWLNIFKLRNDKAAHPQIRELFDEIAKDFQERFPVFFETAKRYNND